MLKCFIPDKLNLSIIRVLSRSPRTPIRSPPWSRSSGRTTGATPSWSSRTEALDVAATRLLVTCQCTWGTPSPRGSARRRAPPAPAKEADEGRRAALLRAVCGRGRRHVSGVGLRVRVFAPGP
ncbi:hypothetical protein OsJ_02841 [Oryza sativa Japonica Group]|uniref:Uncharacterized protein n=1 Tax=Oryza sativa subsp. japonica TaxID=39947 RepID=B9EYD0_ORYSJ|nr:hypothetical protein OsJ_02841 [Oryza sativa Japonica Group]